MPRADQTAQQMSEDQRLAIAAATFNGSAWILQASNGIQTDQLISAKLCRRLGSVVVLTTNAHRVRVALIRMGYAVPRPDYGAGVVCDETIDGDEASSQA